MSAKGTPITLPITGSWRCKLHRATPYSIHGDGYYELIIERVEEAGKLLSIRTSAHAMPQATQPGDEIEISFLMGQVTGIKLINRG